MENLPFYVSLLLMMTTALTLFFFQKATRSKLLTGIVVVWLIIVAIAGASGFYLDTNSVPPRFALVLGPPLLAIIALFLIPRGRKLVDSFDTKWLTWLNIVRVPVEIVLLFLFLHEKIPELMTFEGRNFDILSGLSAPFIAYFGYTKKKLSRTVLLGWNFICLALLLNIVIIAVLSAPFAFQQLAFDRPNIAILYFPFVWLPGFIVPAVLLSHLSNIRQLLNRHDRIS